jgi:CRP-like cAMP-binding protein
MPLSNRSTIRNQVLSALPQAELERLRPHLQPVALAQKQVLQEASATIEHVYFIEEGLASVVTTMADGGAVEVRMLGREGIIGLLYVLGARALPQQVVVQVPGSALQMDVARFETEFEDCEPLRSEVLRLIGAAVAMLSQNAACNRLHSVEQRCARWLLEASNRIGSDTMPMTHEFLSWLLGVRRAGVTETARQFQRSGLIRYSRGRLTIIDRGGLEGRACECYFVDHQQFEWEQPPRRPDPRGRK